MTSGLTRTQEVAKRAFDLTLATIGLVVVSPIVLLAWLIATVDTRHNGLFRQVRIGRHGQGFTVWKIRTMRGVDGQDTTVTTADDPRITRAGSWFRRLKIDELPQLVNVIVGDMSLVGPRPDVPGFADCLAGGDRIILSVRPGITGPAALAFGREEQVLAGLEDPESYNREVLWPQKVRLNRLYVQNWSLRSDVRYVAASIFSVVRTPHFRTPGHDEGNA